MPAHQNKRAIFLRWLWLVYLPLGILAVALPLMFFEVLTGSILWAVGLLAAYCVVPMRLLLETKRKGLELPRPPGSRAGRAAAATRGAAKPALRREDAASAPAARPPVPPKIKRRRAVVGVLGIGVLSAIGGVLFIVGMGRASSGTLGLVLIGIGGFLMLLSVTLPTFKVVDIVLRAIGRLLWRKGPSGSRAAKPAE